MMSRWRMMLPMPLLSVRSYSPALKVPAGINGDYRAGRVPQMGNASHHREGHVVRLDGPLERRRRGGLIHHLLGAPWHEAGIDDPRRDADDADLRTEYAGQRYAHRVEGSLRGSVDDVAASPVRRGDRRDVDDHPIARLTQQRSKRADHRERPAYISRQDRIDQIVIECIEIGMCDHPGEAGGIYEDVGTAEFILHRRGRVADLGAIVHWDAHRAVAVARDLADQRGGARRALVVTHRDARSGGREPAYGCGADAAAPASHNRHFAGKPQSIVSLHLFLPARQCRPKAS